MPYPDAEERTGDAPVGENASYAMADAAAVHAPAGEDAAAAQTDGGADGTAAALSIQQAPQAPIPQDAIQAVSAKRQIDSSRKSQRATMVVCACIAALVALTVLGSLMNVGDHLYGAHPALGWVFYGLIIALVIVGIVMPVLKIAQRPIFSLYQLHDEQGHAKRKRCQMLVDNLIANTELSDEEVRQLQQYLQAGDQADDLLINFFTEKCVPQIDAETKRAASTAFFISAVAHSPLVSTVTMLSLNLDLVRSIVEICGFRPTNLGLARLYSRVMLSALIIGGIEDSDLSDLLGQLMGGGAGARAGGILLGATAEGLVSAFLVFRVGVLTKRWLTAADGPARMAAIRRSSYREALSLMRTSDFMQTVTDTVKQTTGTVASTVASSVAGAAKSTVEAAKSSFPFGRRSKNRKPAE